MRLRSFALVDDLLHHPRRTLDQYYYRHVTDTKARDSDQIVYHHTEEKKLLMVDQLWVFTTSKDNIFTFFPKNKAEEDGSSFADLQDAILEFLREEKPNEHRLCQNAHTMMAYCLYYAVSVLMSKREGLDGGGVIEIFQEAISRTQEDAVRSLNAFIENSQGDVSIDVELVLLRKAADLEDELGILKNLFQEQRKVLETFDSQIQALKMPSLHHARVITAKALRNIDGYIVEVRERRRIAQETRSSILSNIDLKQKKANLQEAQETRQIAKATQIQQVTAAEQGRTMMIFTVFTIVFLPLSFFTSLYGL